MLTAKQDDLNQKPVVFANPFCAAYWRSAVGEFKNVRMLVLCALIVALRVALKTIAIPVGPNLHISLDFFVNSLGAMIYGPVLGLLGGAVSDTIGALVFPSDVYFFPFIFVEMLSSFIFGLYLYRAKLGAWRIIMSRFTVTAVCNLIVNPIVMYYYYMFVMGKSYNILSLPRVIKNVALFPLEAILLVFFLGAMQPVTAKLGLTVKGAGFKAELNARNIIFISILTLLSVAIVVCYYMFYVKA